MESMPTPVSPITLNCHTLLWLTSFAATIALTFHAYFFPFASFLADAGYVNDVAEMSPFSNHAAFRCIASEGD
jgi:hypothetical protein